MWRRRSAKPATTSSTALARGSPSTCRPRSTITRRRPRAAISTSIPSLWERAGVKATRPAAVLVPVVDRPEPAVLLTLRTELPSHPGQIAFPGGKIDPR